MGEGQSVPPAWRGAGRVGGAVVAALLVTALVSAGCSSDDDDSGDAGSASAAVQAAADQYADALEDVQRSGVEAVTADPLAAERIWEDLRDVTRTAGDEFAELSLPDEVSTEHDELVALLSEQQDVLERAAAAARARDDRALEAALARYSELLTDWGRAHRTLLSQLDDP